MTVPSAQAVAASEPAAPPSAPPPPSASPVATSAPASAASGLRASTGGHPATREDCDELFAKSAEIELRGHNITDPKTIAERTAAARATPKGSEFTAQCMGKRITRQALECVRKATTAEQVDDCL